MRRIQNKTNENATTYIIEKKLRRASTGGGGGLTEEQVDDRVAALLQAGDGIAITYDDVGNSLEVGAWEEVLVEAGTTLTLTAAHNYKLILTTSATAVTITVPAGVIPEDGVVGFKQGGAGQITLVGSGTTLKSSDSLKTRTLESVIGIKWEATDTYGLFGDIEPIAPAKSVLVRSANSAGPPAFITGSANGQVLKQVTDTLVMAGLEAADIADFADAVHLILGGEDATLSYIGDKLDVVTTALGTKTMVYTGDKLTSIVGTGVYPSKTFSYTGEQLTGIDVL